MQIKRNYIKEEETNQVRSVWGCNTICPFWDSVCVWPATLCNIYVIIAVTRPFQEIPRHQTGLTDVVLNYWSKTDTHSITASRMCSKSANMIQTQTDTRHVTPVRSTRQSYRGRELYCRWAWANDSLSSCLCLCIWTSMDTEWRPGWLYPPGSLLLAFDWKQQACRLPLMSPKRSSSINDSH